MTGGIGTFHVLPLASQRFILSGQPKDYLPFERRYIPCAVWFNGDSIIMRLESEPVFPPSQGGQVITGQLTTGDSDELPLVDPKAGD